MRVLRRAGDIWGWVLVLTVGMVVLALLARAIAPLPMLSVAPAVVSVSPLDDAALRSPLTVVFNTPMNRRSVERGIRFAPATPLRFQWNSDSTVLTLIPTQPLRPATTYQLHIDATAQSKMYRSLQQQSAVGFRTIAGPQVAAVLPAPAERAVPIGSALMVRFSRPLSPAPQPGVVQAFPALQLVPPVDGVATWLSADTLIFRPTTPLSPATRYDVTIAPTMPELADFGDPYRWSFTTLPPATLAQSPPATATGVAPNTPLSLRLSSAIDPALLQTTLAVTPAVPLVVETALLPDATQQITITATGGWQNNTSYQVTPGQDLADWSFRTSPPFAIVGRFPGEGQVLTRGQDVRLIFTTPIDPAAIQAGIQFDPPTGPITVTARDTEARIQTELQAATAYTVTVPATVTDRAGVALETPFQARFLSAPATPDMSLPAALNGVLRADPGTPTALIRRTNISSLQLALFPLDDATLARLATFSSADWRGFVPERAGLNAIRRWSVPLDDPLNRSVEDRVALVLEDGRPPDAGGYYLQVRTPEGPRADTVVLLTSTRISLVSDSDHVLVALTDVRTDQPLALPVSLYQDGALIARGTTDAQGLWTATISQTGRLVALGGGAAASIINRPPVPSVAPLHLGLDAETYRAGERATLVVLADRQRAGANVALALTERTTGQQYWSDTTQVDTDGVAQTSFVLPDAPIGIYDVVATLGAATAQGSLALNGQDQGVALALLPPIYSDTLALPLTLLTYTGAPISGTVVRWQALRTPLPEADTFTFSDDEQPATAPASAEGSVTTDEMGRAFIAIPRTASGRSMLAVSAVALDAGTPIASASVTLDVPAPRGVGISAARTVLQANEPLELTVALRDDAGLPTAGVVTVDVVRRTWPAGAALDAPPRERSVVSQQVQVDEQGRATVRISLSGGEYRVRARSGQQQSALRVVVDAPGSDEWQPASGGSLRLVGDRSVADAPVRVLTASSSSGTGLITFRQGDVLTGTIQPISAGELLELPADARDVQVQQWENEAVRRASVPFPSTVPAPFSVSAVPLTATQALSVTARTGATPTSATGIIVSRAASGGAVIAPLAIDATGTISVTAPLTATSALILLRTASGEGARTRITFPPAVASAILHLPPVLRADDTVPVVADIAVPIGQTVRATLQGNGARVLDTPTLTLSTPGVVTATWAISIGTALETRLTLNLQVDSQVVGRAFAQSPIRAPTPTTLSGRSTLVDTNASLVLDPSSQGWGDVHLDVVADLAAFTNQQTTEWSRAAGATTPDVAALLRASLAVTSTETALLEQLARAQNTDGGWGWWAQQPSANASTLAALEALTDAKAAGAAFSPTILERGIRWLEQQPRTNSQQARFARLLPAQDTRLTASLISDTVTLDIPAIASLILALPPESPQARPLLERLIGEAERIDDRARWPAGDTADGIVATAWATLALQHTLPDAELTRAAERELAATAWAWERGEHAGMALLALSAIPSRAGTTSAAIPNLAPSTIVTDVFSLDLPVARVAPRQTLIITTTEAPVLARLRTRTSGVEPPRAPLLREYRDVTTGAPLDANDLREGQAVQVRLTVVQERPAALLTVLEPLSALVRPVSFSPAAGMTVVTLTSDHVVFGLSPSAAGIYTITYRARVIGRGTASLPPSSIVGTGWGIAPSRVVVR